MGGISSSVGIFSGIDTGSLISQLLAIEARPKAAAQLRLTSLQSQQAAILDLNTRMLSLGTSAKALRQDKIFQTAKATSSTSAVLTATAGNKATLGSFNFIVNRLVSTNQLITKGFTNSDSSAVGATKFTFEIGGGRLDSQTKISQLNGGLGVDRGKIRITDSTGAVATVDLSTVSTVDEIVETINSTTGISVTASVSDNGLQIDSVGKIEDVFGSQTATSLGIAKTATAGSIVGDQINKLSASTPLSLLNDSAGVAFEQDAGNISSTTPVADFVLTVAGGGVHSIALGEQLQNKLDAQGQPELDSQGNNVTEVARNRVATLGDLFSIISADSGGEVTAAISADGTKIELTSTVGAISVAQGPTNRPTAANLGLLNSTPGTTVSSTRLLAGINSTLSSNLNGGSGLTATDLSITTANNSVFNITLAADGSTSDIISAINAQTAGAVTATLNSAGNGLSLTDTTTGATTFQIAGGAATDLNLTGSYTSGVADSGNLQAKYISEATLLSDLNAGSGVGTGDFTITDSNGAISTVKITSNEKSIFDVLRKINAGSANVNARINDTGDGILIEDLAGGTLALTIADSTGRSARDLNIVGTGDPATVNNVDGSFERAVTFNATDTLDDVINAINLAGVGVSATIINDGFGATPFRIILTSKTSGAIGRVNIDTGGLNLGLKELSKAEDSVVFFGSTDPADGILLTGSSNTLDNVISGVTLDLNSTSDTPVEVNVSRDTAAIEEAIQGFVDSYNVVIDRLEFHGRFNADTGEKGVLLGDSIVSNIQRQLQTTIQSPGLDVQGTFKFLFEAGVKVVQGGKLELDSEKFRKALEQDPTGVAELFAGFVQDPSTPTVIAPGVTVANTTSTFSKLGVAELINQLTEAFTDSIDGVLTSRKNTFDSQIKLQEERINAFDILLGQKRVRLERQFLAMEGALAQLQSQQSALGALGG